MSRSGLTAELQTTSFRTSPYGKGKHSDMPIRFAADIRNEYFDFKIAMDVSFTNNPFAGAYVCKKNSGSDFTWSECADTNKVFATEFNYVCERRPDGKRVKDIYRYVYPLFAKIIKGEPK